MEEEFRAQLERRIASLRGLRDHLHEQLREINHELNSIDRRIETHEELYRHEFESDPPAGAHPPVRRATPIRGAVVGQPSWREAVIGVLQEEGRPLHVKEIWRRLQESGFKTNSRDPLRSIVSMAVRLEDELKRTAPNTFALNGAASTEQQQLVTDQAAKPAREADE